MRKRYYKTLARAEKAAKGQTVAKHRTARGRTLWVVYEEDTRPSKKVSKADREC
jgi:hypothetical protein